MRLSITSQIALDIATQEAEELGSKQIDCEHLFLALCKIEDILIVGKGVVSDINDDEWLQVNHEVIVFSEFLFRAGIDTKIIHNRLRDILQRSRPGKKEFTLYRTIGCMNAFFIAEKARDCDNELYIGLMHLLEGIIRAEPSCLTTLFEQLSIEQEHILKCIPRATELLKEAQKTNASAGQRNTWGEETDASSRQDNNIETPFLDKNGRDITKLAYEGKLDPTIGREEEIKKVAQILVQKRKNNPILVGDAGVGKTCIVEGLAAKIAERNVPPSIRKLKIVELNMCSLIAGTLFRGQFEEKLETIIQESSSNPNVVIFIDEIHTIIGAGSAEGSPDASNILKPALARGEIKCIGATTTNEYRKYIEKDTDRDFFLTSEEAAGYGLIDRVIMHRQEERDEF